jgi:small neutral amino acid transporter SnatA (MarC family)
MVVTLLLLLLLLVGMGPKIALVPFLEKTKHYEPETQRAVGRRMVVTAVFTAIVLFATGALLMRLLHITAGAVAVAGPGKKVEEDAGVHEDPLRRPSTRT